MKNNNIYIIVIILLIIIFFGFRNYNSFYENSQNNIENVEIKSDSLIQTQKKIEIKSEPEKIHKKNEEIKVKPSKTELATEAFLIKKSPIILIGKWLDNGAITFIFKRGKTYYMSSISISSLNIGKDYELIVKNLNGEQGFILKDILYPKNLNGVKLVNEYTDYYYIEKNGDLSLYDKIGFLEKYIKLK